MYINHITINVINLVQSKNFYEKALGLKSAGHIDMDDHKLIYYDLGKPCRLELIVYDEPEKVAEHSATCTGIYRHMALEVEDIQSFYVRLKSYKADIVLKPTWVEKLNATCMLVRDPNGVEIELMQTAL